MIKFGKTIFTGCLLTAVIACSGFAIATTAEIAVSSEKSSFNTAYAPEITVEWGEYSPENIPEAVLGASYRIFNATAEDIYGEKIAVDAKVWLHYTESTKSLITLKNDTVIPAFRGIYTVEYTARDSYGNASKYTYDFLCNASEPFTVQLSGGQKTALAGNEVELATASFENAQGIVTEKITAVHEEGKVVYTLNGKQSFVPEYAGKYTLSYEYQDYNQTVEKEYELTVEAHETPVFFEEVHLPDYFIVGKPYTLPSAEGYQFATGAPVSVTPEITVTLGSEKAKKIESDRSFVAQKEGVLTFTYTLTYNGNKVTKKYVARAVDVGYGDSKKFSLAKYFYAPDAVVSVDSNQVILMTEREGATASFLNELVSHKIDFDFALAQGGNNFGRLDILLTDSQDSSVAVKFSYIKVSVKESIFSVNDGRGSKITTSYYSTTSLSFSYLEKTMTASLGEAELKVSKTTNGEAFSGFPSGKVKFSFSVSELSGRVKLYLYKLNNQTLYRVSSDRTAPMITFSAYEGGEHQVGDVITVQGCYVGDVLDNEYTVQYAIKSPSGEYVIDENGVLLSEEYARYYQAYSFKARELGGYTVEITASDGKGNKAFYSYAITVNDKECPEVKFQTEMPAQVKKGEKFIVGGLIVRDNVSTEYKVFVCIIAPNLKTYETTIGTAFIPTYEGTYTVSYMVEDESGNVRIIEHTFKVV